MTIHQKIGQMLLFGWQTDAQAKALIDELRVGGVVLMGRNIDGKQCVLCSYKNRDSSKAATVCCIKDFRRRWPS